MIEQGCTVCGGRIYSLDDVNGRCAGPCGRALVNRPRLLRHADGRFPPVPVEVPEFVEPAPAGIVARAWGAVTSLWQGPTRPLT